METLRLTEGRASRWHRQTTESLFLIAVTILLLILITTRNSYECQKVKSTSSKITFYSKYTKSHSLFSFSHENSMNKTVSEDRLIWSNRGELKIPQWVLGKYRTKEHTHLEKIMLEGSVLGWGLKRGIWEVG